MTKPKTWADRERSLDVDWPPHQPITLTDLVAGAPLKSRLDAAPALDGHPSSLGSEEQMFGADEQVRGTGHSD
jgi:hypothetical protein